MNFFKVKTFAQAKQIINNSIPDHILNSKVVSLLDAQFEIASEDIFSSEDLPQNNRSTVDGYALNARLIYGASESIPSLLKVVGNINIGELPTFSIFDGECAKIVTGGILPDGANSVLMKEYSEQFDKELFAFSPVKVNENVSFIGDDIKSGQLVCRKGQIFTPFLLGVLAGIGIYQVPIYNKIKLAIISSGDELISIDEKAENGKIRDINTTIISTSAKAAGFDVVFAKRVSDEYALIKSTIMEAVEVADIVILSGGSSVGEKDFTAKALQELGKVQIEGIAIKPGKPTLFATINDSLVFGLPGHPLACALTFKTLICDLLNQFRGVENVPKIIAKAKCNFPSSPGKTTFIPVKLSFSSEDVFCEPVFLKSACISPLALSDGYIVLPDNCEGIYQNGIVHVYSL